MKTSLLPDGLAGIQSEATPSVEAALRAVGVGAVEAQYAEDRQAMAELAEATRLWLVCDVGIALCDITEKLTPSEQDPRADSVTLTVTPWSEVRGVNVSATINRPSKPLTTLTVLATSPTMNVKADDDTSGQLERLRDFAAGILRRLAAQSPERPKPPH